MSSLTKTKKTQNNTTTTNNPVTRKRCPNGQRRNKQGDCVNSKEPTEENLAKLDTISPTLNAVPLNAVPVKRSTFKRSTFKRSTFKRSTC